MKVKEFCSLYMRDEFDDFKKVEVQDFVPEQKEEPEPEKEEVTPTPEFNVIKIHGEDFVLTPVEKKNDQ